MKYSINEIAEILEVQVKCSSNIIIKYISIDSRRLLYAPNTLFFAIRGDVNNGHDYITSLYKRGVRAFVIDEYDDLYSEYEEACFFVVPNTINSLHRLMTFYRSCFSYPVLGITGSNGKTIVKEWLAQLLFPLMKIVRSPRSYNSQVGVPLSLALLEDNDQLAIIEAGISKRGEMNSLQKMINPDFGILTNIGIAHDQNFSSREEKLKEKLKLFKDSKKIVVNSDDIETFNIACNVLGKERIYSWGKSKDADLVIYDLVSKDRHTTIKLKSLENTFNIEIPFIDKASIQNCLNCIAFLLLLNTDIEYIKKHIKMLRAVEMRLEIKEGINNCILVNDYYNSDIASIEYAIDLMKRQSNTKKKTIIISDFIESTIKLETLYHKLANILEVKGIDRIIGIGQSISKYINLFKGEKKSYLSTNEFLLDFQKLSFKDEVILLRGARKFHFENLSNVLEKRAHRTVLEINLNAIEENLNFYRSLLKNNTKITVMVKAFSYGSGLVDIAKILEYNRVDFLAVAIADEGISLRNSGITTPIIVMNPEEYSFSKMIDKGLEPNIYSIEQLKIFSKALDSAGVRNYPIHIKLDTGMHRLGFIEEEIPSLVKCLKDNDRIKIRSIFSHLAGADDENLKDYTLEQLKIFKETSDILMQEFDYNILRHILNSAGIEAYNEYQYDMVRLGLGLYGISPLKTELSNVSTLKTTISQIKHVSKDDVVGYSCKGILSRESKIAVIPIGYADGFNRKLGNGVGSVLIKNKLAKTVGNICMDMCMIDVTDIQVEVGDEVIIFGEEIPVSILAEEIGTIPYEILTSVSERVKRVYISE